jgi:hypothetical protein
MQALRAFIPQLENNLQLDSGIISKTRHKNDQLLKPLCHALDKMGITPNTLTLISIVIGLSSFALIFVDYWYCIAGMAISLFFDLLDGSMTRNLNIADTRSLTLKFLAGHWLMIGLSIAFCFYLHQPLWAIIPAVYSVLCYFNFKLDSPFTIPCGKNLLFIPAIIGLPEASFAIVALYSITLAMMLARNIFYPLQNAPLVGHTACPNRARVVHLS